VALFGQSVVDFRANPGEGVSVCGIKATVLDWRALSYSAHEIYTGRTPPTTRVEKSLIAVIPHK